MLHTMKKLPVSICLILLILFCACSGEERAHYVIGVSQCSDDLWRETMNGEMRREASFHKGVKLLFKTVKDNTAQQIRDIESLMEADVDLLVISPNESAAITPVVERAYQKGIPVVLVDRRIDSDEYTAYIGADNYQIGMEAGRYVANLLHGAGNVVEIRGWNGSTSDKERHEGFLQSLRCSSTARL